MLLQMALFHSFLWLGNILLYVCTISLSISLPMKSHLFIFVFIFITLGGESKKILLWFMSKSVLPMFSSKSFIVSGLTVRSLIHFEFIFVYGVRECSNFILLHPVFPAPLLFLKFIYLFIYFWLCWVFVSVRGLSLVAASRGHFSSRCADLSLSQPLLLWSAGSRRAGSVPVAHGPSCSVACEIFPDQGSNLCPLHWQADSQPLHHQGSSSAPLLEETVFSPLYILASFVVRLVDHRRVGLSLGFLSSSIDLCFCFCASTILS